MSWLAPRLAAAPGHAGPMGLSASWTPFLLGRRVPTLPPVYPVSLVSPVSLCLHPTLRPLCTPPGRASRGQCTRPPSGLWA